MYSNIYFLSISYIHLNSNDLAYYNRIIILMTLWNCYINDSIEYSYLNKKRPVINNRSNKKV